jgi:hypothetical protein
MIEAHAKPFHQLLSENDNSIFEIPAYQREYAWGKDQWDALFDDLLQADVGTGHFFGSIIFVNNTKFALNETNLQLVDGQQRMTTMSLLMLALYKQLAPLRDNLDEEQRSDVVALRRMLILKNSSRPRLRLQKQSSNAEDYLFLLNQAGLDVEKPSIKSVGNRQLSRALIHLSQRIEQYIGADSEKQLNQLFDLFDRLKNAILVAIEVKSYADAFVLFESLNNRGMPLTPIDLIKTSFLALADKSEEFDLSKTYEAWSEWIEELGSGYSNQERFFRQFYNAFKSKWSMSIPGAPIATRSRLIKIYDELINRDLDAFMVRMNLAIRAYGLITRASEGRDSKSGLEHDISKLARAQAAPGYMLVMYLLVSKEELGLSDDDVAAVVRFLTKFFVRRNVTNTPPTYDLDPIFVRIVDKIEAEGGDPVTIIIRELISESASDATFKDKLSGRVYEENAAMARVLLIAIEERTKTLETMVDFWKQDSINGKKEQYVWTIEHVFPQGENIPEDWVEMQGGSGPANVVRRELVHTLGNLTITGYNSSLGNKSFVHKRDRQDSEGRFTGYKNGLYLNNELANRDNWTRETIEARTIALVDELMEIFSL